MASIDLSKGSINYAVAYSAIVTAARSHGLVTYQQLALLVGLPMTGNHLGNSCRELLETISREEHAQGRPMLSSVVVNAEGIPSVGYYILAKEFGKFNGDGRHEELEFWHKELNACYKVWQPKIPKDVTW